MSATEDSSFCSYRNGCIIIIIIIILNLFFGPPAQSRRCEN